jgi:hypothetical protein
MNELRPHDLKLGQGKRTKSAHFRVDDQHIEHIVDEISTRYGIEGDERRTLYDFMYAQFEHAINSARLIEVTARHGRFYRWAKEECRTMGISVTTMLRDLEIKPERLATWRKKVPGSVEVALLIEEYIIRARANGIRRKGHTSLKEYEANKEA